MNASTKMTDHARRYLAMRRALGCRLKIAGQQLFRFAEFLDREAPRAPVTVDLILQWAQSSSTGKPETAACRLRTVRPFVRYLKTIDSRTHIPGLRLLGPAQQRCDPHIYSDQEIADMLSAAKQLQPSNGLRPYTMWAYIGLLAATGMRPAEALSLTGAEVDLRAHLITIHCAKFSKDRFVVLHPTATKALERYVHVRDSIVAQPSSSAFFMREDGTAFTFSQVRIAFQQLRVRLGWLSLKPVPRLYDLRHTFVCRRMLSWYRSGTDVHRKLLSLSTYLGHANATHTYWYISGIPELMEITNDRFEALAKGGNVG